MALFFRPGFICIAELDQRLVQLMWQCRCPCRGRVQFLNKLHKVVRCARAGSSAQTVAEWQNAFVAKASTKPNGSEKVSESLTAFTASGTTSTWATLEAATTYVEIPVVETKQSGSLNEEQVAVVEADAKYVRVVAGPGSGKTKVLTHRIVHMINNLKVSPSNILCITFTNKAAQELLDRLNCLLGEDVSSQLTVGTIHSACARLLRNSMRASDFHLDNKYVIYTENDSEQVVKRILQEAVAAFDTSNTSSAGNINGNAHFERNSDVNMESQGMQGAQTLVWKDLFQRKFLTEGTPERLGLLRFLEEHEKRKPKGKKRMSITPDVVKKLLDIIKRARLHNVQVFLAKKNRKVLPTIPHWLDAFAFKMAEIYECELRRSGAADFDDLMYLTTRLLHNNPYVLKAHREKWRHALVDEFQDIDGIQYELIRLLSIGNDSLFVVGDIDQAIYGWRGANANHMQYALQYDFLGIVTLQLTRNYRSSSNILKVAAVLLRNISYSRQMGSRKALNLLPMKPSGEPICIRKLFSPVQEADFIASEIQRLVKITIATWDSFAILYRTHAQSFFIETSLTNLQIPYASVGSMPFYSHKEIKDVLAYLRLAINCKNERALERVINTPPRGIGQRTLACLNNWASSQHLTLPNAIQHIYQESISHTELKITSKARNALLRFWELIEFLTNLSHSEPIGKIVKAIIERTNFKSYVDRLDNSEKSGKRRLDRLSNLQVLDLPYFRPQGAIFGRMPHFEEEASDSIFLIVIADSLTDKYGIGQTALLTFLQDVACVSDQETMGKEAENTVKLMTLHAAKGLEFDCVFIIGLQENLLPLLGQCLDEERRLLYVGITRAIQRLYLSFSMYNFTPGMPLKARPSRFLEELLKSPELRVVK